MWLANVRIQYYPKGLLTDSLSKVRPRSIPGLDFDSDWWKTGQAAVRAAGYSPMSEVALVPPEKLMFHSTVGTKPFQALLIPPQSNIGDPMDDSPPW